MVALAHLFRSLHKKRILVAGDFLLDRYTFGASKRISPEAPVPVVLVEKEDDRPGGAGNVVINIRSLGMEAVPFGCVGRDVQGDKLKDAMQQLGISVEALLEDPAYVTPLKMRVIAGGQQMVRVDYEQPNHISEAVEKKALGMIPELVRNVDVIAISDYAKGFLTDAILRSLIAEAKKANVAVICDPKGIDFSKYSGATVLKPNLSEAIAAARLGSKASLEDIAQEIFTKVSVDVLMITRSEFGISLYFPHEKSQDFPVQVREVRDVTGAGDTVLAMFVTAVANGLPMAQCVQLANMAANVAVEKVGCAAVTLPEVARRCIDQHSDVKIFSDDTVCALNQALQGHVYTLLQLDRCSEVSPQLIKTIRHLGKMNHELVVAVYGLDPDHEIIHLLASLKDVDYIFLAKNKESYSHLECQPSQIAVFP